MANARKAWMFSPAGKKPKASLPGTVKDEVDTKAKELIETVLKPKHIEPPPKEADFNYLIDITTKWLGSTCYFIGVYHCPGGSRHRADLRGEIRPPGVRWGRQVRAFVHAAHRRVGAFRAPLGGGLPEGHQG